MKNKLLGVVVVIVMITVFIHIFCNKPTYQLEYNDNKAVETFQLTDLNISMKEEYGKIQVHSGINEIDDIIIYTKDGKFHQTMNDCEVHFFSDKITIHTKRSDIIKNDKMDIEKIELIDYTPTKHHQPFRAWRHAGEGIKAGLIFIGGFIILLIIGCSLEIGCAIENSRK